MQSSHIRAVIVDDEPLARRGIRLRLEEEADFDVVAEYESGAQACAGIPEHEPDVVFLDIQMPGMNGFDVVRSFGQAAPAIVFLTAYESHALDAFEVCALDYILKPASDERLDLALARVRAHVATTREASIARRVRQVLEQDPAGTIGANVPQSGPAPPLAALHVRERGRILLIAPEHIDWIEAVGNYVRLHVRARSHIARYTIAELETRLAPAFVRIHRGTLVNRARIAELQSHFHGDYVVVLADRTVLRVGRKYRSVLLHED
jgi:two-component system LytT family response regulator